MIFFIAEHRMLKRRLDNGVFRFIRNHAIHTTGGVLRRRFCVTLKRLVIRAATNTEPRNDAGDSQAGVLNCLLYLGGYLLHGQSRVMFF